MSDDRSDSRPVLSVIVPVYNEAGTVDELLRRVMDVPVDKQVVVVDDGSTDGTATILQRWENDGRVQLLRHQRNRGMLKAAIGDRQQKSLEKRVANELGEGHGASRRCQR